MGVENLRCKMNDLALACALSTKMVVPACIPVQRECRFASSFMQKVGNEWKDIEGSHSYSLENNPERCVSKIYDCIVCTIKQHSCCNQQHLYLHLMMRSLACLPAYAMQTVWKKNKLCK